MANSIKLAFLWHMHQPCYRDPESSQIALPWVRLHASRAYFDMAWLLERYPDVGGTFNLVPILTEQINAYIEGERDQYWHLSRKPARLLNRAERSFILDHFFSISHETGIRPRTRYWALFRRARSGHAHVDDFSDEDFRDLQTLFNLAWFGFAARVEYPILAELEKKGSSFNEDEKLKVLDVQMAVLNRVFRSYERLAAKGQIEMTATPYYHPILPLLIDSEAAKRCQPDQPRPQPFQWPEDAKAQVEAALDSHERNFGVRPQGIWPAEGAISPEAVSLLAEHGAQWVASDEALLWNSLPPAKGGHSKSMLYAPYSLEDTNGNKTQLVFRDRELSDLIGFSYSRSDANAAINDFIDRLEKIGDLHEGDEALVVVALDGENPWEYYAESGLSFLSGLYDRLTNHPRIKSVPMTRALTEIGTSTPLDTIHSASWIDGNYSVWIGQPVENEAWDLLGSVRAFYEENKDTVSTAQANIAYKRLLEAEGSDWFWWYGDRFSSENDDDFDRLFRGMLKHVYVALGHQPPARLERELSHAQAQFIIQPPKHFISPRFDSDSNYFDWSGAGVVDLATPGGSMCRTQSYFGRLRYGFDLARFYLKLDRATGEDSSTLDGLSLMIRFGNDQKIYVDLDGSNRIRSVLENGQSIDLDGCEARYAAGLIEVALAFEAMNVNEGEKLYVSLHLVKGDIELARFPGSDFVSFEIPTPSFEAAYWTV